MPTSHASGRHLAYCSLLVLSLAFLCAQSESASTQVCHWCDGDGAENEPVSLVQLKASNPNNPKVHSELTSKAGATKAGPGAHNKDKQVQSWKSTKPSHKSTEVEPDVPLQDVQEDAAPVQDKDIQDKLPTVPMEKIASPRLGQFPSVAFLKLEKVAGSTVAGTVKNSYVLRNKLQECPSQTAEVWNYLNASKTCKALIQHDYQAGGVFQKLGFAGYTRLMGPNIVTATVLRQPQGRILSRFFFTKCKSEGYGSQFMLHDGTASSHGRQSCDYSRFTEWQALRTQLQGGWQESQYYLAQLSRMDQYTFVKDPALKKKMLEAAHSNLDQFDVVGITEQLNYFMAAIAVKLGVPPQSWTVMNEKTGNIYPSIASVPSDILDSIREQTTEDQDLYDHAKKLAEPLQHLA